MAVVPEVAPIAPRGPDILVRTAPPLSATTDGPLGEVAKPPVSASNDAGDQDSGVPGEMSAQDQADARTAKVTDTTSGESAGKKPAAAKTPEAEIDVSDLASNLPGYAVREISKARKAARTQVAEATAQAEAAARTATEAADAVRAELAELRAKLEAAPAKPVEPDHQAPAVEQTADARPTRDTFDDPDAYDTALSEWAMREGVRSAEAKIASDKAAADAAARTATEAAQKAAQEAEIVGLKNRWETSKAKATEKYADYASVAEGDHTVSVPMAHAILALENGPDVAYHLGKNPEESARIAAITNPMMQVLEVGKIAARLAAPPSRAPRSRPLEPIDGSFSPADTSGREPSMEEVAARVNGRYQAGRRPFLEASPGRH